jgi:hypothetical protein
LRCADHGLLGDVMEGPVYLHIGMKKTGTSYLQSILRASTDELGRQGVELVPRHEPDGFWLARAVLGRRTAGDPLAALPRQLVAATGSRCLITQELLGRADRRQIARLVPALADHDVHVVVTVRDVARTIPSAWQQYVKAGHSETYDEYRDAVLSMNGTGAARTFWRDHGVVDMVQRWERLASPSSIHVVIRPQAGSPPEVLLERFCSVIGIEPDHLVRDVARPNESLGLVQVEVLRRLNEVPAHHARWVYGKVYKRGFARGVLGEQPGRRALMPDTSKSWCRDYTDTVVEALTSGGYDVVGDLEDLRPPDSAFTDGPQSVSDTETAAAAVLALRALLEERVAEEEQARASRARRSSDG